MIIITIDYTIIVFYHLNNNAFLFDLLYIQQFTTLITKINNFVLYRETAQPIRL